MLSSQTKDEVTNTAIANLRAAFGGSVSLEAMIEADEKVISEAISKVGFWRRKTGYVLYSFQKPGVTYLVQQLPQASCNQITGRVQLGCAQHCR